MSIEDNREGEEKLVAELKSIVDEALAGPDGSEVYGQFAEFVGKLKKDHPDIDNYRLFHVLSGSGIIVGDVLQLDLPNGEIEKFIRSLKTND